MSNPKYSRNNQNQKSFESKNGQNPNRRNQNQQAFDIMITNYHRSQSPESILQQLSTKVLEVFKLSPNFSTDIVPLPTDPPSFKVSVNSYAQFHAILLMNGILIFNYPIWIVKFHSPQDYLGAQVQAFRLAFLTSQNNGLVDLNDFESRFRASGGITEAQDAQGQLVKIIDFNNRDFVEYFFYSLGLFSIIDHFWVSKIILTHNNIENINGWGPFFHFLPNLKYVNLNSNKIYQTPNLKLDYQIIRNIQFEINTMKMDKNNDNN